MSDREDSGLTTARHAASVNSQAAPPAPGGGADAGAPSAPYANDLNMTVALLEVGRNWHLPFSLGDSLVAAFRVGSHSHGTYVPPEEPTGLDDTDYMLVVIPPPNHVLGFQRFEHHVIQQGQLDVVVYEWGKYVRLLAKNNPNVVGTLWLHDVDWFAPLASPFTSLRANRVAVMSKRMVTSFMGYAEAQRYKMQHHERSGYMGAKRKALVEQFGYDTKNAAHMIRLLRMCREYLRDGTFKVNRCGLDASELIVVKRGGWSLEAVIAESYALTEEIRVLERTAKLQSAPSEMLMEHHMLTGYFGWWRLYGA